MTLTENVVGTFDIPAVAAPVAAEVFVTSSGVASATGALAIGVSAYAGTTDDGIMVKTHGVVRVVSAAAISPDTLVQSGDNGKAVGVIGSGKVLGTAVTESTGANQVILVKIPS